MIDLQRSSLRSRRFVREDFNPGDGVMNLADVMLVFSCGLLAAIISFWNVSLPNVTEVAPDGELSEMDAAPEESELTAVGNGYNELGAVFEDPVTGKLYMVLKDTAAGASDGQ